MEKIVRLKIYEGVNFTYIPETKFKTTQISFSFFVPLDKNEVSKNAVIPNLLSRECNVYPSVTKMNKKLEELYGASITSSISKVGDFQVLTVSACSLNNIFIPDGSDNIQQTIDLLCETIFNPYVKDGAFDEKSLNDEKRQLIEDIRAIKNDKKSYAKEKCEEIMCKGEKYGINELGTVQSASELTPQNVYESYKKLLQFAPIEIVITGCCAYEKIIENIKKKFSTVNRTSDLDLKSEIITTVKQTKVINEVMDVNQCKLVMGLRTGVARPDDGVNILKVLNAMLGGTAQSKLFLNVREKLSLCYYCSSKYNSYKGIMTIESGVEKNNIERAKNEILNQLKDLTLGNFSDTDLEETKLYLSQSMQKIQDNISDLNSWYLSQVFDKTICSPDEAIEKINSVSREQIIKFAENIKLDTIFILAGNKE